eukprot:GGOE01055059.1.p1 GENE.GGOE01055059.1~~GGOE01055059.1.p1  ORF type:complete len:511 (+),score=133.06 GGOE01055059.1:97-1533(+)
MTEPEKKRRKQEERFDDDPQVGSLLRATSLPKALECDFSSTYYEAWERLSLSYGTNVVGREEEKMEILQWMKGALGEGSPVLYVSGIVGSGKTLVVSECEKELRKLQAQKKVPEFHFVSINALRDIREANQFYRVLWDRVLEVQEQKPQKLPQNRALEKLSEHFSQNMRCRTILLLFVDEVDFLLKRDMKLLYNLFQWPCDPHSYLRVLAVSNELALIDRFQNKLQSRAGHKRVQFNAYTTPSLEAILKARLKGCSSVINDRALKWTSTKIGSCAGDARKALQICSCAIAEAADKSRQTGELVMVDIPDMQRAAARILDSLFTEALRELPPLQFLLMASIAAQTDANRRAGGADGLSLADPARVSEVVTRFLGHVQHVDFRMPPGIEPEATGGGGGVVFEELRRGLQQELREAQILTMLVDLATMSLIHIDLEGGQRLSGRSKVLLNMDVEDIKWLAGKDKGLKCGRGFNSIFEFHSG